MQVHIMGLPTLLHFIGLAVVEVVPGMEQPSLVVMVVVVVVHLVYTTQAIPTMAIMQRVTH